MPAEAPEAPPGRALVIDAANVVGSVPDGWWRDRLGANVRLRDALVGLSERGLPAHGLPPPLRVVLVVEGQARSVASVPGVMVVAAPGSGDDTIVDLCALFDHPVVVTADRGLITRVEAEGGRVLGPRAVRPIG